MHGPLLAESPASGSENAPTMPSDVDQERASLLRMAQIIRELKAMVKVADEMVRHERRVKDEMILP